MGEKTLKGTVEKSGKSEPPVNIRRGPGPAKPKKKVNVKQKASDIPRRGPGPAKPKKKVKVPPDNIRRGPGPAKPKKRPR